MKKYLYLGVFMITLFVITSCSSSTPGGAAKQYVEYLKDGKYEKFVDGIAFKKKENVDEAKLKEQKESFVALLKEKSAKELEKKGGIKNIELVSETIDEDGNKAKVVLKVTFGNGTEDDENYNMVKEDGKWKMNMGK